MNQTLRNLGDTSTREFEVLQERLAQLYLAEQACGNQAGAEQTHPLLTQPHKKTKGAALSEQQKAENKHIACRLAHQ